MKSLYSAVFLVLTARYFPAGTGKPVNTGWQPYPLPPPDPKEPVRSGYAKGGITKACEQAFRHASGSFDAIAKTPEKDRTPCTSAHHPDEYLI